MPSPARDSTIAPPAAGKTAASRTEIIRDRSRVQPELPGARAEQSPAFINACRDTHVGSWKHKLFYLALATFCRVLAASDVGTMRVYLRTLAHAFEMHDSRVREYLMWLEAHGLIDRKRTGRYIVIAVLTAPAIMRGADPTLIRSDSHDRPVSGRSDRPVSGRSKEQDGNGNVPTFPGPDHREVQRARAGRQRASSAAGASGLGNGQSSESNRSGVHRPSTGSEKRARPPKAEKTGYDIASSDLTARHLAAERAEREKADPAVNARGLAALQASLKLRGPKPRPQQVAKPPAAPPVVELADREPSPARIVAARALFEQYDADHPAEDEAQRFLTLDTAACTDHVPETLLQVRVERAALAGEPLHLTCSHPRISGGSCELCGYDDGTGFMPDPDRQGNML